MSREADVLRELLMGMRAAYARGENAMAFARAALRGDAGNDLRATLIAYDLQAGSYIAEARRNAQSNATWCRQLASLLEPLVSSRSSVLEVGCGEATTLAGVLQLLGKPLTALGLDISWSRLDQARHWVAERNVDARLFVADLFNIPLQDDSVDVVYTSHSLEPNGGREREAIGELLRVARSWVVLVEPLHELASAEARDRMESHGYVRGLRAAAEQCGAEVTDHRLLPYTGNPLNPSGVVALRKKSGGSRGTDDIRWRCPLSHAPLTDFADAFFAFDVGIAYPVLRGIPMLRAEHAIVASRLEPSR